MRNTLIPVALAGLVLAGSAGAKDFGTWGNVFEPAEQDMLVFIQDRLQSMEQSGEMERLKNEAINRVKRNAVRPPPVAGLTPAIKYRSFSYDPTFTVKETISDMKGNIIARKGDQVNPFDKVPFSQTLYFIDGDNPDELAWVKKEIAGATDFKVILVKGNIRETSEALDERVYFDQAGIITSKLGFEYTPARVSRDDRVLKIEEIPVSGAKK
ncbi:MULTISPECIES: type-F conjugative transfer system protein TraW [Pseudescherichia]|uniref:type-F conjugative transfer system protein TraW n=1 Tax=Pseudescherichia TaxID=2055880 RepID=UPI0028AAC064|nr:MULTISPECIES: type-F conjugative transfer system protein TraW [Pseudescherichia]